MFPATQQKIIEAAIEVFNDDLSAPLEKVADKAGLTRRTLHRYFKDRNELIVLCQREMEISCRKAMKDAFDSSNDPLKQLENIMYAGIDCGAKYSFFHKLHQSENYKHTHNDSNFAEYDALYKRFKKIITTLQNKGIISRSVTAEWILMLHSGIVATSVNAASAGTVARVNMKQLAWFSFSKGIGI